MPAPPTVEEFERERRSQQEKIHMTDNKGVKLNYQLVYGPNSPISFV